MWLMWLEPSTQRDAAYAVGTSNLYPFVMLRPVTILEQTLVEFPRR